MKTYILASKNAHKAKEIKEILGERFIEEPLNTQKRLTNLFTYILELFKLIKDNNYNLSGLVYGLK